MNNINYKKFYLDMNIYEDYLSDRNKDIKNSIDILRNTNIDFFYSPAHMEELAVILRKENNFLKATKYIFCRLINISKLTQDFEFLPSYSHIAIKQEHPSICFYRVIKDYDLTILAEENEKLIFSIKNNKTLKEYFKGNNIEQIETFEDIRHKFKIETKVINNYEAENLFKHQEIIKAFNYVINNKDFSFKKLLKWKNIKNSHSSIERILSLLYNFLEVIGYHAESTNKIRSRMHDVSHGIYATASDVFVTGDEKFYKKTKAIYKFLEIPTIVFNKSEFNEYVTSIK